MVLKSVDDEVEALKLGEVGQADVFFCQFAVTGEAHARCSVLSLTRQEGQAVWIFAEIKSLDHQPAEGLPAVFGEHDEHVGADGVFILIEAAVLHDLQELEGNFECQFFVRLALVLLCQLFNLLQRRVHCSGLAPRS